MVHQTLPRPRRRVLDDATKRRDRSMEILQYATAFLAFLAALVLTVAR